MKKKTYHCYNILIVESETVIREQILNTFQVTFLLSAFQRLHQRENASLTVAVNIPDSNSFRKTRRLSNHHAVRSLFQISKPVHKYSRNLIREAFFSCWSKIISGSWCQDTNFSTWEDAMKLYTPASVQLGNNSSSVLYHNEGGWMKYPQGHHSLNVTWIFSDGGDVQVVKVEVTSLLTVSQSVSLSVEPTLGLMTMYYFLSEGCCLVSVGRPLWRADGSVICAVITQWSESRSTRNQTLLSHQ
jgi:hypothetical protein